MLLQVREFKWGLSVNEFSDVEWTDVNCVKWFYFELKWSEVKWVTVMFLGIKVPCTLGWSYTEGTWLYCDYVYFTGYVVYCSCFSLYCGCFNLFCNVWVCVCVGFVMCGCFCNMYTGIYYIFIYLKILDARRMTWGKFHIEHPAISGATVLNLVARAT
jgi:hypothetical protein